MSGFFFVKSINENKRFNIYVKTFYNEKKNAKNVNFTKKFAYREIMILPSKLSPA